MKKTCLHITLMFSGDGSTREAGLAKLASIDEILEYEQELALEEAMVNFSVL